MVTVDTNKSDFKLGYELKTGHIEEVIEKLENATNKYSVLLEKAKSEKKNSNEISYLEGLRDGIQHILEPLKNYNK